MATVAERLETIRDNLLTAITEATANPKPSYSNGPRSVSWTEYMNGLMQQLQSVEERLARAEPVEVITQVHPVH